MTPQDYLRQISTIVGHDISEGKITLHLSWNDRTEAQALLLRLRTMQKQLRLLKKDVSAMISGVKSQFMTARTSVGKTFGAGLAGAFFGRRAVGRVNAARRDDLRRTQLSAVAPYERVKGIIDQILYQLDTVRGQIELSPEYQVSPRRATRVLTSAPSPPALPPPPAPPLTRYFVYIGDQVKGPYSREQLRALRDAAAIARETLCCLEGTEEWLSYSDAMA